MRWRATYHPLAAAAVSALPSMYDSHKSHKVMGGTTMRVTQTPTPPFLSRLVCAEGERDGNVSGAGNPK